MALKVVPYYPETGRPVLSGASFSAGNCYEGISELKKIEWWEILYFNAETTYKCDSETISKYTGENNNQRAICKKKKWTVRRLVVIRNEAEKAQSVENGGLAPYAVRVYEVSRDGLRLQFEIALEHRLVP